MFGTHDPLRDRRVSSQKWAADLLRREATRDLEGERELRSARQRWMTTQKDQRECVVHDAELDLVSRGLVPDGSSVS